MPIATAILYGFNALGFGVLLRWGGRPERVAAMLMIAFIAATPFASALRIGDWRIGTALCDLVLLIGLLVLSERHGRWWLIFAASAQLVVVVTHVVPILASDEFALAGYFLRLGFWLLISITLFFGAWEAWADRKYRLEETRHGESYNPPPRLRDAG